MLKRVEVQAPLTSFLRDLLEKYFKGLEGYTRTKIVFEEDGITIINLGLKPSIVVVKDIICSDDIEVLKSIDEADVYVKVKGEIKFVGFKIPYRYDYENDYWYYDAEEDKKVTKDLIERVIIELGINC